MKRRQAKRSSYQYSASWLGGKGGSLLGGISGMLSALASVLLFAGAILAYVFPMIPSYGQIKTQIFFHFFIFLEQWSIS